MEELEQSWFGGKSTWQWHVKWTKGRRWDKCGEWYSSCYNRWRKRSQNLNQCNGARSITGLGSTGYCQDIRCLHQFPTKSFKSETTSRGTPWVLSWPPSVTHRLPAALVSKEGETRDSLEQCMGMQTETFPVMSSWLVKPRWQVQPGQWIRPPPTWKIAWYTANCSTVSSIALWTTAPESTPSLSLTFHSNSHYTRRGRRKNWVDEEFGSDVWPENMICWPSSKPYWLFEILYPAPVLHKFLRMFCLASEWNRC